MRVLYYSQTFFTDCDFPLIRELKNKGITIKYLIPLNDGNKKQALLEIKQIKLRFGIFKAIKYPEMIVYKDYLDLNNVYFINFPQYQGGLYGVYYKIANKLFYRYIRFWIWLFHPDVFHYTWQFRGWEYLFGKLSCKKMMTVHDPLPHSSVNDDLEEKDRIFSFEKADRFMLLSKVLSNQFSNKYGISKDKISFSKMGEFSFFSYIKPALINTPNTYILYYGQISSYKGIEYLCEAMVKVHAHFPKINLIIAGRGDLYFNYEPYKNLGYIELINKYLSISEISALLHNSLFAICPYKDATQSGVVQTSFSCNTPMIVTNVGALPEVVKDNVTGIVVPPCDSDSLANAIDILLSSPELLNKFRANIERVWRPTMSWEPIANNYINAWNQLQ